MFDIEEWGKAISEVAKLGNTSVEATGKLGVFLAKIFGVPIENAIGLLGDKLEYIRWERQNRMVDKVNEDLRERGLITVRSIPPKFAIPLIVNSSLEEDNDLQDIWCRLIANSLDPNFDSEIRYAFIDIIKNLTYLDAQILEVTYNNAVKYASSYNLNYWFQETNSTEPEIIINERFIVYSHISKEYFLKTINCEKKQLDISIDNLLRVKCFKDSSIESSAVYAKNLKDVDWSDHSYSLTSLGVAFVEACIK